MVMRSMARITVCRLGIALALSAGIASAATDRRVDDIVRVEDVQSDDATVRGRLVNETNDALENVRLIVADQFLWRNERHPGDDSPSTAHSFTVPGPVPPHGSVAFEFRRPSRLPDRPDGEFTTDVSTVEVTRRPIVADTGYETRTYERRTYEGPPRDNY